MILCLDVGNTHIYGGLFEDDHLVFRFRYATNPSHTSDQLGLFIRAILKEHDRDPTEVKQVAISSVVPNSDYSIRSACVKYLDADIFVLRAGVKTGLKIKTHNPKEVGADLIAGAIAATHAHPNKNVIVVDFGTATTLCAISHDNTVLGVTILPGCKTAMQSLHSAAAKLPAIEIKKPAAALGKNTEEALRAGIYYGQLASIKELCTRITEECFNGERPTIVATGGFSQLFREENLFDAVHRDLVLEGLRLALLRNPTNN